MDAIHEPLVLRIGEHAISGMGIALVSAAVLGYAVVRQLLRARGEDVEKADDAALVFIGVALAAKLFAVLVGGAALVSRSGFSMLGGSLAALPLVWLVARLRGYAPTRLLDTLSIAAVAVLPVARTGCWAIGDDYGIPTHAAIGVRFPDGSPPTTVAVLRDRFGIQVDGLPTDVVPVHPVQLYDVALGLLVFGLVWRARDHRHAAGWLSGYVALLLGAARFVLDFVKVGRVTSPLPPLTIAQVLALGLATAGIAMMAFRWREPGRARNTVTCDELDS